MCMMFAIIFTYLACSIVPRLLVELVATVIGLRLVIAHRRACRTLLELARSNGLADGDRKSGQAERRALKRGLNAALDMMEFTSLLPHVADCVHKFARW